MAGGIARDSSLVSQSGVKGLPEHDSHVFDRVVKIDLNISFCFDHEIKASMFREERQHVIEKRNSCIDRGLPCPVDEQIKTNFRLPRFSLLAVFSDI